MRLMDSFGVLLRYSAQSPRKILPKYAFSFIFLFPYPQFYLHRLYHSIFNKPKTRNQPTFFFSPNITWYFSEQFLPGQIRKLPSSHLTPLILPLVKLESMERLPREEMVCNSKHYAASPSQNRIYKSCSNIPV